MRTTTSGMTIPLLALTLFVSSGICAAQSGKPTSAHVPAFAPDRVLIKFRPGTAAAARLDAHRAARAQRLRTIAGIDVEVVRVERGTVPARLALYQSNPNVQYAEPDYYRLLVVPTEDPGPTPAGGDLFEDQWHLNNTGQWHTIKRTSLLGTTFARTKGRSDADIDAPEGWDLSRGRATVDPTARNTPKIAVLDSGASCDELDLQGKCLEQVNVVRDYTGEQFWDDVDGDVLGHGTFVASEAAAHTDNGLGIAGAGWSTGFGAFKVCYRELVTDGVNLFFVGLCPVSASIDAIMRASTDRLDANGVLVRSQYHVITMSYGSDLIDPATGEITPTAASNAECDAAQAAWERGVVLVAAAGNNATTDRVYPAACTHSETGESTVIAVAASDDGDNRAGFSTYSTAPDHWVSMAAPGEWIVGILPHEQCGLAAPSDSCVDWWSGTSMAAPLVAGAAALVWSRLYELDEVDDPAAAPAGCTVTGTPCNRVVRERLERAADKTGAAGQDLLAWTRHGRLNLATALAGVSPVCGDGQVGGGEVCDTADPTTSLVDCSVLGDYQPGQTALCISCAGYDESACSALCTSTESPETSCADGIDNDCDGAADSADSDCGGGALLPKGAACTVDSQCASNHCKGRTGDLLCK